MSACISAKSIQNNELFYMMSEKFNEKQKGGEKPYDIRN